MADDTQESQDAPAQPAVQRSIDKLVGKTLLWAFPSWVKPNHLTILRLVFIPVILVLLYFEHRGWALLVFVLAVLTDLIDGAMARRRDQTTSFGTYVDPLADKLLVAAVLAWVGWQYLVVDIFLGFIALELILMAIGVPMLLRANETQPSNFLGKGKMIIQSLALFLFLLAGILGWEPLTEISLYLLWVALALAAASGGKQILDIAKKRSTRPKAD